MLKGRLLGVALAVLLAMGHLFGATEEVVFSFRGQKDAGRPRYEVAMDKSGDLYGVATGGQGGTDCFGRGCGFVYKLHRTPAGKWKKTNLYAFTGRSDGGVPVGKLAIDAKGNLYGVTEQGGTGPCDSVLGGGCGVVFQLAPKPKGGWKYSVIHTFDPARFANDGAYSNAGVVFDKAGNLYGTTEFGGGFVCDCGIVYQLKPSQGGQWTETVLYSFIGVSQGGSDVSFPTSGVAVDDQGNIFGTGSGGGDFDCNFGCGGVYQLIPQGDGTYQEQVLKTFSGGQDGMEPEAGVILDAKGNIYGTTEFGGGGTGCNNGGFGCGTVFELNKSPDGTFRTKIIYRFGGSSDGYAPFSMLNLDGKNTLYGTTEAGGDTGSGVLFRLTKSPGEWKQKVLHSFGHGQDGSSPQAGVTDDGNGGLFGTTPGGGALGAGTVFHFIP